MPFHIAVTTGEPAGIGPEICVKAVFTGRVKSPVTLIGDKHLLMHTAETLGFGSMFPEWVSFGAPGHAGPTRYGQFTLCG